MKSKEIEKENITIGDYSVYVTGFPEKGVDSWSLTQFFEQFGPVVECTMAKRYKGCLFDFKKLAEINRKYQHKKYKNQ